MATRLVRCLAVVRLGLTGSSGVIAGAFEGLEASFPKVGTSSVLKGVVTCSILIGALLGSAFGSFVAKLLNKKRTALLAGQSAPKV